MRKSLLFLIVFCISLTNKSIAEESWGAAMFPIKRHDFGRVALSADAEFRFELTNHYNSEIKLLNVHSSCSCTAATLSAPVLQPGEIGAVVAKFNTSGQHLREKSAVLTVQMETEISGTRRVDTVQLFVTGYIRPDVVLSPGSVEFGAISEGDAAERTVLLEYAGNPNWALMKIERSQSFIHARAEEIRREYGNVTYQITVTLKENAPVGYVKDVLRFTTNELQPGKNEPVEILLPIQGVVTATIHAKPSPLLVGILSPGETATKSIAIRSETPFRITNVSTKDKRFRFAFSEQESVVQLISISFSARQMGTEQPQDIADEVQIFTDNAQQKFLSIRAFARVLPEEESSAL